MTFPNDRFAEKKEPHAKTDAELTFQQDFTPSQFCAMKWMQRSLHNVNQFSNSIFSPPNLPKKIYQERALHGIAKRTNSSYEHFIEFPKALERWLYKRYSKHFLISKSILLLFYIY